MSISPCPYCGGEFYSGNPQLHGPGVCKPAQRKLTFTCPDCKQPVEPGQGQHGLGLCIPKPPGFDTEQAFWDACVAAHSGAFAGTGALLDAVVRDSCDVADTLVIERRKRIAARTKGG